MRCPARPLAKPAQEIHGHSFRTEVSVRGTPDPATGMVLDLGLLEQRMTEVQKALDHKLLNRIDALGPPTLENLSRFIWERVQHAGRVTRVSVHRDSCNESCTYYGPQGLGIVMDSSVIETRKNARGPGSRRCATTSARPSSGSRTRRPPRSIPATPAASCARPGSAPMPAARPVAAA